MSATTVVESLARKYGTVFGTGVHAQFLNWESDREEVVSSGSAGLDAAIGVGGFPRGRLTEIFGKEATGKTTLALAATGAAQQRAERTAYLDLEKKLSKNWVKTLGVNPDQTLFLRCSEALEAARTILQLALSAEFSLIVMDSLAALIPCGEIEEHKADHCAELESIFERVLPRIAAAAADTNTCILLLNQVRPNHDQVFGDPLITPGGNVLRHSCSLRIELAKTVAIKTDNHTVVGQMAKAVVKKNSVAAPFKTAQLPFTHAHGLDKCYEAVVLAKTLGLLDPNKPYIEYQGIRLGMTEVESYQYLLRNRALATTIIEEVASVLEQQR